MRPLCCLLLLFMVMLPAAWAEENTWFQFPPAPPAWEYGNLLLNRASEKKGAKAATFSHWLHRRRHTCRVCHFELEFGMKANTTEITEDANRSGRFCGASGCHDGKAAFGHEEPHCKKCHNGEIGYGKERISELSGFPKRKYGNGIDWDKALGKGLIKPLTYLSIMPSDVTFDKTLNLQAEWFNIPPAIFPHKTHVEWLDCNNCHPDIFNIKKKATKHFSMALNLKGEFCGTCHLTVAFPMNDCRKCHPGIRQ